MWKLNSDQISTIKQIISSDYEYAAVYIYGSYARGTAHINSDIDICVKMPEGTIVNRFDTALNTKLTAAIGIDCHVVFCTQLNAWCEILI